MLQNANVDMISVCNSDGSMQPLRFRYEDEKQCRHLGRVVEILCCEKVAYVGVEAYVFTCRAVIGEEERLLKLKYSVRGHRWCLVKELF